MVQIRVVRHTAGPAVLLALLALVSLATPLAGRAAPELSLSPTTVQPGARVAAVAIGFPPGSPVSFVWDAEPGLLLGTANADETGRAVLDFDVPASAETGGHIVRACPGLMGCQSGIDEATATIDVAQRSVLEGDDVGGSVLALLVIAALALGLGAMTGARLRRTIETFKPPPRKAHDHELDEPSEGRPGARRR